MEAETISCIIPVYNAAEYLGEALDSVLSQTRKLDQIIVVDDGSTDDSVEVARQFSDHIELTSQPNQGPAAARNRGLQAARGDFVAFLDADDVWHVEKTSRQLDAFARNPALEVCMTYVENFWIPEMQDEQAQLAGQKFVQAQPGYVCQCLLARREVFDRVGLFNEDLRVSEDTDWFWRAEQRRVIKEVLPEVLVFRRIHRSNSSYALYSSESAKSNILQVAIRNLQSKRAGPP